MTDSIIKIKTDTNQPCVGHLKNHTKSKGFLMYHTKSRRSLMYQPNRRGSFVSHPIDGIPYIFISIQIKRIPYIDVEGVVSFVLFFGGLFDFCNNHIILVVVRRRKVPKVLGRYVISVLSYIFFFRQKP